MAKKTKTKVSTMSVKEYIEKYPGLTQRKVWALIKDGKIKAHKNALRRWVIEEEEPSDKTKKTKSSKTYSTKEFLEIYNKKHPKNTITLIELRLMLTNGKLDGEKVNNKWVVHQSPSKQLK